MFKKCENEKKNINKNNFLFNIIYNPGWVEQSHTQTHPNLS